jgi:hypothetical protein
MENKIETNVIKPSISFFFKVDGEDKRFDLIDNNDENELDSLLIEIESFIKENSGKGKSEEEKDKLYADAQLKWKSYFNKLRSVKYNFFLNREQWNFLTNLILTKLEYDVDTLFFAIELTDMLGTYKNAKFSNDSELKEFKMNATEITYIYHLIAKYKVKGLTKDAYTFSKILLKIGDLSKVINYYDTTGKNHSDDIQKWVLTFEDGVSFDKTSE